MDPFIDPFNVPNRPETPAIRLPEGPPDDAMTTNMLGQYWDWLIDKGGIEPDRLFEHAASLSFTPYQRSMLLRGMDDLLAIHGAPNDYRVADGGDLDGDPDFAPDPADAADER